MALVRAESPPWPARRRISRLAAEGEKLGGGEVAEGHYRRFGLLIAATAVGFCTRSAFSLSSSSGGAAVISSWTRSDLRSASSPGSAAVISSWTRSALRSITVVPGSKLSAVTALVRRCSSPAISGGRTSAFEVDRLGADGEGHWTSGELDGAAAGAGALGTLGGDVAVGTDFVKHGRVPFWSLLRLLLSIRIDPDCTLGEARLDAVLPIHSETDQGVGKRLRGVELDASRFARGHPEDGPGTGREGHDRVDLVLGAGDRVVVRARG